MKETNQIIALINEEGITWGKIYNTLIPVEDHDMAVIIDDNDERHELINGEFDCYYGVEHLKNIALMQMDTDIDDNNLEMLIEYTYKLRKY